MKYPKQLEAARSEAEKAVIRVRTVKQKIEEKTEELMGAGGDVVGLELDVRRQLAKAEVDGDSAVNAPSPQASTPAATVPSYTKKTRDGVA